MATFEDLKLIFQAHANLENLRRDMRANAQAYKAAIATRTVEQIVPVMIENTTEYLKRLKWSADAWADLAIRAKVQSGLAALSIPQSELTGAYQELKAVADAERTAQDAGITTAPGITAAADATLAGIASHATIWPNG